MKRFCRESPAERLGYQKDGIMDIKKHKWFQVGIIFSMVRKQMNKSTISQGFDWDGLLDKSLSPPLLPSVQSVSDASNFDQFPRDTSIPSDENSGWDTDF